MVKLSDLRVGNTYYMVDDFDTEPVITEFIVVEKKKGIRVIENIKHLANDLELDDDFMFSEYSNYEECRYSEISKKDLKNIFTTQNDIELVKIMNVKKADYKDRMLEWEMSEYIPPHEYPDWDGDESIMYYLDHYVEEDEDCNDEY